MEVVSDPEHPAVLGKSLTKADGTALDFLGLMKLAETRAVRFANVMTCLNLGCPLDMGLWEGVPLRDVVWLTQPREDLRRVFYFGHHNGDSEQMIRSSLPIGRVLEDPYDLPPVILCYKLNGQWLDAERRGPAQWLTHVVLTNLTFANDTYAEQNNDVDSPLKTFAATLSVPTEVRTGEPMALPLRLANVHWAAILPGQRPGEHTFRSRSIDEKENAQPLPRPFCKSGHAAIESVVLIVKE